MCLVWCFLNLVKNVHCSKYKLLPNWSIFHCHVRYLTLIFCIRVLCLLKFISKFVSEIPRAKPQCNTSSWKACSIISKLKTLFCLQRLVWLSSGGWAFRAGGSRAGIGFEENRLYWQGVGEVLNRENIATQMGSKCTVVVPTTRVSNNLLN